MAICRCKDQPPKQITKVYVRGVEPLGFGDESIISGDRDCINYVI
jgi:hypothetical protein